MMIFKLTLSPVVVTIAILFLSTCTSSQAGFFVGDKIDVTINVQDESGKPIPYVTVWQFAMPQSDHVSKIAKFPEMDDLWRVTTRYKDTSEYMLFFGEMAIHAMYVIEMGDEGGVVETIIDYQYLTGRGNDYKRPEPTNFGFTFLKHGYIPEKIEFNVPRNKSKVEAIVTLKRDPNQAIETAPYIQEYERLRYLLSDSSKDEALTKNNQARIAKLEKALEAAAQQAIAAGDKKAAARMYIRMRYLPDVSLGNGVVSYAHVNRESERSKRVWNLAKELDPDNLFIQMFSLYDGYRDDFNDLTVSKEDLYQSKLDEIEKVINKHGLSVWPEFYSWRADLYLKLNQPEKSKSLFNEIIDIEPKYDDWEAILQFKNFRKKN
jgi:hypothetical protein